jgi:hypothetical protein
MQVLNAEQEYYEYIGNTRGAEKIGLDGFIEHQIEGGVWVEDNGSYFLAAEWDDEQAEVNDQPDTSVDVDYTPEDVPMDWDSFDTK